MESNRSKKLVATTKEVGKKFYNSLASLSTKKDEIFYTWIPILMIIIATIGFVLAQFANCTFPFSHFLFGLTPQDRILG
jgi:hypothetical protein